MLLGYFRITTRRLLYQTALTAQYHGLEVFKVCTFVTLLIIACLLLLGSAFVGRLFDAGYLKSVLTAGGILLVFTTCMTSLSTEWYQLFLSQGIGAGIAVGIIFIPGVACVSTWFKRRRAAAIGIVASGSSVGAVILPTVAEKLIPKIGFPWALRVIALIQFVTMAISIIVMKSRLPPRKAGPWIDPVAFKQVTYSTFTVGAYFAFWGLYTPFFYSQSYAEKVNAPANVAPYVLSMMNVFALLTDN
jgi:MFS transporter, MCT family, solute carrier family 16 (monocarboxylic acid transporters), member 3